MRPQLESLLALAQSLAVSELPQFLGQLEQIRVTALARITAPVAAAKPDQLLDVQEAAGRLRVGCDFLYRNHARLAFTRRLGKRLLFSSNGIDQYLKKAR